MLSLRHLSYVGSAIRRSAHLHLSASRHAKVALILSGSGVYDGSEIHEASACLVALSREGADVSMFAPDVDQLHVIDHTNGEPQKGVTRNVLTESARIARGNIQALSELKHDDFSALIVPGGFGAAKNLCTFAVDGVDFKVNLDVRRILLEFHAAEKPIGMCCIAPVLAAKVLHGCEVTVGHNTEEGGRWPHAGTTQAIATMGAVHVKKDVTETHTDTKNKLVTTPAFMCETAIHEVFDGISNMVKTTLKLTS